MKNKSISAIACCLLFIGLAGCKSHYELGGINRTRILIDSRYDYAGENASKMHGVSDAIAFLAPYKQKVDSVMGPVLGEVARDMYAKRPESELSNLLPDILMYMAKDYGENPDFSVYNVGGIRSALAKGKVTFGDVLDVAPFENKISFVTLTGDKVMELFRQIAAKGGEGVSHGVELVITKDDRLVSAKLNGKEIDPEAKYRITTIDYLVQGNDQLTAFKSGTDINSPKDEKYNSRYIIAEYFRKMTQQGKVVDASVEGRIKVIDN